MQKYALIGGILSIVSGGFGILLAVFTILFMLLFTMIPFFDGESMPVEFTIIMIAMAVVYACFFIIPGVLAIVGGVFCIKRRSWPLALAGAIAGSFTFNLCGIAAIIFTTLAKPEFDEANLPSVVNG